MKTIQKEDPVLHVKDISVEECINSTKNYTLALMRFVASAINASLDIDITDRLISSVLTT
jgi:hypothetical protein